MYEREQGSFRSVFVKPRRLSLGTTHDWYLSSPPLTSRNPIEAARKAQVIRTLTVARGVEIV